MDKLQEIKEEVVKVYPEIMEQISYCKNSVEYNCGMAGYPQEFSEKCYGCGGNVKMEKHSIPITLEHILGVMKKRKKMPMKSFIFRDWTLGQPLDKQKPEVIDFIYSLIVTS